MLTSRDTKWLQMGAVTSRKDVFKGERERENMFIFNLLFSFVVYFELSLVVILLFLHFSFSALHCPMIG